MNAVLVSDIMMRQMQLLLADAYAMGINDGHNHAAALIRSRINGDPAPEPPKNPFLKKDE